MNVRIIVSLLICAGVIILGTVFFATRESAPGKEFTTQQETTPPTLTFKDSFTKGVHTISGEVTVPTPCVAVSSESSLDDSEDPNTIEVRVTTTPSEGICLERSTTKEFSLKVKAPAGAVVRASLNGVFISE